MGSKRLAGPMALTTSAATVYTAPSATVVQRGRVSNPTASPATFTMSLGQDAVGTRLYSAALVPAQSGIDIWGPFSLAQGDVIQAFGSSASLVLNLNGSESTATLFTTNFSGGAQNPIGPPWVTGTDPLSSVVQQSAGGLCYGTQTGNEWQAPLYNDSQAYLQDFPPNHRGELTVHLTSTPIVGDLEVEVLLAWSIGALHTPDGFGPTHSYGIEVNWTMGEFGILCYVSTFLLPFIADFSAAAQTQGIQNGDILAAQVTLNDTLQTGTVIVSSTRGGIETILGSVTDARFYLRGNPGIGFFRQNNGTPDDPTIFCASAYTARAL